MNFVSKCGGGGKEKGALVARRTVMISFLIVILALSSPWRLPEVGATRSSTGREELTSAFLSQDDLIEGRMEASELCGLRYPPGQSGSTNGDLFYIVGGDQVDDDQFWPWSVAIYELDPLNGRKGFICSGSLISDKFVLTAAHCIQQSRFDTLRPEEIFLRIAAIKIDDESLPFYRVEEVYLHPEYLSERKANDIALLRLASSNRLPLRARPICLPSKVANRIDFTDQQVTIIGWGKTSAMSGDESTRLIDHREAGAGERQESNWSNNENLANEQLLQAHLQVTDTRQCNKNYSRLEIDWLHIDEHFLCARDPLGKRDACQGDSGGPLMWNTNANQPGKLMLASQLEQLQQLEQPAEGQEKWYQLGVISFGHGCANSNYPGVYARISYYMPWILKIVNGQSGSERPRRRRRQTLMRSQHEAGSADSTAEQTHQHQQQVPKLLKAIKASN